MTKTALCPSLVERVETKILETYLRAQTIFKRTFPLPKVTYEDKGRVAGYANFYEGKLNFSPTLLSENTEHFIENIIPHEVCHLVTRAMYPHCQSHGQDWKQVMRQLGVPPTRCHQYDVSNVARKRNTQTFKYRCGCRTMELSKIMHNKIQRGSKRLCKQCRGKVSLATTNSLTSDSFVID